MNIQDLTGKSHTAVEFFLADDWFELRSKYELRYVPSATYCMQTHNFGLVPSRLEVNKLKH